MYGLYIYSNNFSPEIHAFHTVQEAKRYAERIVRRDDVTLDEPISEDKDGFYASGHDCGLIEFECRRIKKHGARKDKTRKGELAAAKAEVARLKDLLKRCCAEDGYLCEDCACHECPHSKNEER